MINLIEVQKDTILGLVNEIFSEGKFVCPTDDPVKETETVIGEVADYEKAIILAANVVKERCNQQIEEAMKGDEVDESQLLINKKMQEVLFSLFWLSVKNRLGETATAPDAIGLRKDWQLVAWEEDKRRHSIEVHCISLPFPFLFGD